MIEAPSCYGYNTEQCQERCADIPRRQIRSKRHIGQHVYGEDCACQWHQAVTIHDECGDGINHEKSRKINCWMSCCCMEAGKNKHECRRREPVFLQQRL